MIKRKLFNELKSHLKQKEISFIIGPRQVGKTTLMLLLKGHLEKRGQKTVFLNLDIENDRQFFTTQLNLVKKIELEIGKKKGFVFIDEIQRKENAGIFLKGIFDMNLPYKLIVSGSGSVELKEKIHESLVGRKRIFKLNPVSFREFVNFKNDYRYEKKLATFFDLEKDKTKLLLDEYLNFGGYPRVVLAPTLLEKKKIIEEIYQSYLEKDITYLLGVKKSEAFSQLTKIMAGQIGNLVNFSELSSTLAISTKTVKNYLWYLEKTFILTKITPFFKNVRKEITKAPVFYFYDLGLRNYALGSFGNQAMTGFIFENFVFNILKEEVEAAKIHFWRTKDGAAVDLVCESGQKFIPIEIKYKKLEKPQITKSFRSFLNKYQPKTALVVNLVLDESKTIGKTKIIFLPFWKISSNCLLTRQ